MQPEEIKQIITLIKSHYKNYDFNEEITKEFYTILKNYNYEYVSNRLIMLMSKEKYQLTPPNIYLIIDGLPKISDEIKSNDYIQYCPICHRPFNNQSDLDKHFDRCSSIRYIEHQTKKWFKKEINKKEWYEMDNTTFDIRYNKLLKYIYENTTDENEKIRIGYIFNPPSIEETKKFLNKE